MFASCSFATNPAGPSHRRQELVATVLLILTACSSLPSAPGRDVCRKSDIDCTKAPDRCPDAGDDDSGTEPLPPDTYVGPFATRGEHFAAWDGERYRRFFVRGVNLGAALPGDGPNDLKATEEMYARWFDTMREGGVNALRPYVLQFPSFYRTLAAHNRAHPEAPIFLIQGIWLPEPDEKGTLDLHLLTARFDANIEEAVDAIHGKRVIPQRTNGGWGIYDEDVSSWTLGWLPGREVLATEIISTDRHHAGTNRYDGERLRVAQGSPSEVWIAERLDHLVDYERRLHDAGRPFAFSNWLELDPIKHPTEGRASGKDVAQVDLSRVDPFDAPAGYFVSYHAYPYYPNFVSEDPGYRMCADDLGPNSYLGLLRDLRDFHAGTPLFIAEYGVPSSWGRAHSSHSGMHHGGLDEAEQGTFLARMIGNIHDVGAAGGAMFHWTDGWWKRIWITNKVTFPSERLRLWHDMMNAQQHYGLVAFELPPPAFDEAPSTTGDARIRDVRAAFDAEFVHLRITLNAPLLDGDRLVIGLDTYADDRGETLLPNGARTTLRNEFALSLVAPDAAELQVLHSYDLRTIGYTAPPGVTYRSTVSDSGDWAPMKWRIAAAHSADDGSMDFPEELHPIGVLRSRRAAAPQSSRDAVVIDDATVTIRLPWTLLHFADPSRRRVIDDAPQTPSVTEVFETPGIAFAVSIGGTLVETPRLGWPMWNEVPETRQRMKAGAATFFERLHALPTWLD